MEINFFKFIEYSTNILYINNDQVHLLNNYNILLLNIFTGYYRNQYYKFKIFTLLSTIRCCDI